MPMYVDVTKGMRGWFAVIVDEEEGPIQSSPVESKTKEGAVQDAIAWAEDEGLPCKATVENCRHTDPNCACY